MQNRHKRFPSGRWGLFVAFLGVLAALSMHGRAGAQTLSNRNSIITLNLGSSAGMTSWTVDGNNEVNDQWFYFRIGSSGPAFDLSTISAPVITQSSAKQLTATYNNSLYSVTVSYQLTGGSFGGGHSALTEQINFNNLSPSTPLDLHFYMYSDFTLGGAAYANSQNVALATSPDTSTAIQTVTGTGFSNTIAIPTPPANEVQAALYPQLFNELTTSNAWTLNNISTAGPGHVTWGMEWDTVLGVLGSTNSSLGTISVTDTLQVPEPVAPALALFGLGLGFCARGRLKNVHGTKEGRLTYVRRHV